MTKRYEKSWVAVDAVIFTIHDKKLKVFLKTREKGPFKGKKELIGGLLIGKETAEETLRRKLKETTGQQNVYFQQFNTFTSPKRDPRERAVSIGFVALINKDKLKDMNEWHDASKLPDLAFDHKEIINKGKESLKNNISPAIVKQFLPKEFPLNQLQDVYELIEEKRYDNRNFRKRMISSGIVKETQKSEKSVSHRPAKLFRFN